FEVSKQFWAWLVENNILPLPGSFIKKIPHMSFVWDEANITYLKKRYNALQSSALFDGMEWSQDRQQLTQWIPLMMNGRSTAQKLAATRMEIGTDVNFGSLTRNLFSCLQKMKGVTLHFNHEVRHLTKDGNHWR